MNKTNALSDARCLLLLELLDDWRATSR